MPCCFLLAYVIKKVLKEEETTDVEKKENEAAADVSKEENVRKEDEKAEDGKVHGEASHTDTLNGLHSTTEDSDVFEDVETIKNDEAKKFSTDKVEVAAKCDGKERDATSGSDTEVVHVVAEKVDEVELVVEEDKLSEKIDETKSVESSEIHSHNHEAFEAVTADHVPSSTVLEAKHGMATDHCKLVS